MGKAFRRLGDTDGGHPRRNWEVNNPAQLASVLETLEGIRQEFNAAQSGGKEISLTAPEMTALVGGLRVLGTDFAGSAHGVLTDRTGALSNDFFRNLLDLRTAWNPQSGSTDICEGHDRATEEVKWTGTYVDLIFSSSSELRAVAEVYASADGADKFARDFAAAWGV